MDFEITRVDCISDNSLKLCVSNGGDRATILVYRNKSHHLNMICIKLYP